MVYKFIMDKRYVPLRPSWINNNNNNNNKKNWPSDVHNSYQVHSVTDLRSNISRHHLSLIIINNNNFGHYIEPFHEDHSTIV